MTTYKLGTRGSLLAVTQSTLVKNELERISGEKIELVLIKTQGDVVTNKPLWQLEGKDFFTKELDEALLKGDVDFVVHSYKDLGSVRPEGIKLAAVTERKFAHDILLINKKHIPNLITWEGDFVVGTSSPRRIANLTHSLAKYLPHKEKLLNVKCEMLRGNINSRIRKLKEGHYHAITLALAGVERLAHTEKSKAELTELLEDMDFLILPQSVFPSAASQGALGIEIRDNREDQDKLARIIAHLSHDETIEEVLRERKAFKDFGGGCHLAVGIHVKKISPEHFLHVHSGEVDGKRIDEKFFEGQAYPSLKFGQKLFVGLPPGNRAHTLYDEYLKKIPKNFKVDLKNQQVFVTSRYCVPSLLASLDSNPAGLWAAGSKSAQILTSNGLWINGTADSLGTKDLELLRSSKALEILSPSIAKNWTTLSHESARSNLGPVIATYTREEQTVDPLYEENLKHVGACFWTSFIQYEAFVARFPFLLAAHHFCGLGKTWQEFEAHKVKVYPLAAMDDFYKLIP
jgi:hydroxymethylbilane synthase